METDYALLRLVYMIVTRSKHVPRILEVQASAYHVLREPVELAGADAAM